MEGEKIIERITTVEQSVKSAHRRLDKTEKLTESIYTIASETKALREDMNRMQADLDEVRSKPIKRFEAILTTLLTAIISAGVGYILSGILKG